MTLDTSHFEMSPFKDTARMKMALMSVTLDTSHVPIDPCRSWEHSPFGEDVRQVVTALLSSALDCGEKNILPTQEFGEMEITRAKKMT